MSTKSEINISTIWDIFKVEIVPEAPGGKLVPKSRLGEVWKEGGNFFSHFSGGRGGEQLTFYSIFSGGKGMLAAISSWYRETCKGNWKLPEIYV